jgi:hypothetical protein
MKLIMNLMNATNAMNWKDTNKGRRGRKKLFAREQQVEEETTGENCHTPRQVLNSSQYHLINQVHHSKIFPPLLF